MQYNIPDEYTIEEQQRYKSILEKYVTKLAETKKAYDTLENWLHKIEEKIMDIEPHNPAINRNRFKESKLFRILDTYKVVINHCLDKQSEYEHKLEQESKQKIRNDYIIKINLFKMKAIKLETRVKPYKHEFTIIINK